MSLFLGKVHYWLFNKIKLTEDLEKDLLKIAEENGLPVEGYQDIAYQQFEAPLPQASLESLIDHKNIHGWLQHRIKQAESRLAFYVTKVVNAQPSLKNELLGLYAKQALTAAKQTESAPPTPESMLQSIHDFLLEGMPCDRAQQVLENTSATLAWKYEPCLHKDYWTAVEGDVTHFYAFRKQWIESYVTALQPSWQYSLSPEGVHTLSLEGSSK